MLPGAAKFALSTTTVRAKLYCEISWTNLSARPCATGPKKVLEFRYRNGWNIVTRPTKSAQNFASIVIFWGRSWSSHKMGKADHGLFLFFALAPDAALPTTSWFLT